MTVVDDLRVCFIGDSFVAGIGDPDHLGWAGRLAARSHRDGTALSAYNLGVRRQTSVEVAHRFLAECDPRLPAGCRGRVVVSFGVNDTTVLEGRQRAEAAHTRQALQDVLDRADSRGWTTLVVGPPPVADAEHNARTAAVEQVLAALCQQRAVPFVAMLAPLQAEEVWMAEVAAGDGAHPGAQGYQVMADLLWPHWQRWLAS